MSFDDSLDSNEDELPVSLTQTDLGAPQFIIDTEPQSPASDDENSYDDFLDVQYDPEEDWALGD